MAFIRCAKCLRAIEVKGYVALKDGTNFHRECFTCECCHQEMPLKFAFKNGRYFHTEVDYGLENVKYSKCYP